MTRFIKVLTFAVLAAGVSASVLVAQNTLTNPKFAITLSAPKTEVVLGKDIVIHVKQTNISDAPIHLAHGLCVDEESALLCDVRNEQGTPVAEVTEPIRPPRRIPFSGPIGVPAPGIAPGQSIETDTTISIYYQFNRPRKYTIQASQAATSTKPDDGRVYSNTITITVLPADAPAAASHPPAQQ